MPQPKKQIQPGDLYASIAGKIRGDLSIPEEFSGDVLAVIEWVFVPAYRGLRLATLDAAGMNRLQSEKPSYYQKVLSHIQKLENHFRERAQRIQKFSDAHPIWFIEIIAHAHSEKGLLDAAATKPEKRSMIRKFLNDSNAFATRKNDKEQLAIFPLKVTPSFIAEVQRFVDEAKRSGAKTDAAKKAEEFLNGLSFLQKTGDSKRLQDGEQAQLLTSWFNHLIKPRRVVVTKEDVKQARKSIRKHLPNK